MITLREGTRLTIQTIDTCKGHCPLTNETRQYADSWKAINRLRIVRKAARKHGIERIAPRKWKVIDRDWSILYIVAFH